ncbi:hypothetical protein [Glaciihabitans sp. dw_435]|uniref:hypothetical protein n=1 Tax=Glaciihabitans sp. dw_435 TaxID=2720081 RepID=UPI001BD1FD41|nr:hypothetical protein [Glaciihabitans sp. dw_435]
MPVRVITAPGHSRIQSLGWLAVWWIETFTVHGPGDVAGTPVRYGDEYTGFIVDSYALDGNGRRLYDSAFFSRPKGCDKSGVAAALALFEALGPARFLGFAKGGETYEFLGRIYTYKAGEPMGRRVKSPFIRIMATEETQTGNVFDTIFLNLTSPSAPLFALQAYGMNPGVSKIALPGGGVIQPSTAGSASKDGGIETFVVFDESHLYITPQLKAMFRTVSKNLRKRKKIAETWYLETTTMYAPGEASIAEETYGLADAVEEGLVRRPRMLFNHRWGEIPSLRDPANPSTEESQRIHELALAEAFREAYGDAIEWNSIEGLIDGVFDTRQSEAETRRYFFNALVSSANAWFQVEEWTTRGRRYLRTVERETGIDSGFVKPWRGDEITLGFDGAETNDATALVACRVRDNFIFPILIEETPDGPEADGYIVDFEKFDAAVAATFEKYKVVGFYADPPYWRTYLDKWSRDFGDQLKVHSSKKHSIAWYTKNTIMMDAALERLHTAILNGDAAHDDDTLLGKKMTRHFQNARNKNRRGGTVIEKEAKNSVRKIDAAMAATLAFEAAADYRGSKPAERDISSEYVPFRAR